MPGIEESPDFDIDRFEKEMEEAQKKLDKACSEVNDAILIYEKMQAEYKKYQDLERQLKTNPPNAEEIKVKMTEIEKKADAMLAEIQTLDKKENNMQEDVINREVIYVYKKTEFSEEKANELGIKRYIENLHKIKTVTKETLNKICWILWMTYNFGDRKNVRTNKIYYTRSYLYLRTA